MYLIKKEMLPDCIVQLIKSFLPEPPKAYVQEPLGFSYSYVRIEDWNDTQDLRAYGDY